MKFLLVNSCHILKEDARKLSLQFGRDYKPVYTESDVYNALAMITTYSEYDTVFQLNESISFQWLHNSHCLGAAQLQLILTNDNKTRKILYTSDLGSLSSENHFVSNTYIPEAFNDVVLMESTYGNPQRSKRKTRNFDLKKLKAGIETVLNRKGKLIIPCFSFFRTQEVLLDIYNLFHDDPDFNTDVVVDSALSVDICKAYNSLLWNEDREIWNKVMNWDRLKLISRKDLSIENVLRPGKQIVLSSSGFCTNGRIVSYLQENLRDINSMICFTGYTGDNPTYLAYRIQNAREQKTIRINHKRIKNNADCMTLSSYSSHATHKDLVAYAGQLKTNAIILVHGDPDAKAGLKPAILEECSKQNKSTQVIISKRKMIYPL